MQRDLRVTNGLGHLRIMGYNRLQMGLFKGLNVYSNSKVPQRTVHLNLQVILNYSTIPQMDDSEARISST